MLSAKMEDYLKAIYTLGRRDGEPVSTSSLAEYLDVTPPTATSMMETLDERGFVDREKYRGVTLTPEGRTVALEVIRHHRLLETYLAEQLGYDWSAVHDEADRLEHHISEEFERRVATLLDDPDVDPHGDPIPNDKLEPVEDAGSESLGDYDEGSTLLIRRVSDRNPDELSYLQDIGLTPDTVVTVSEVSPIGMITLTIQEGDPLSIPQDVAESIYVDPIEQPTKS